MAGVAAPAGDRKAPPVGVQIARGIGWTAFGLTVLLVGLVLVTKPGGDGGFAPQWEAIAVVGAFALLFGVVVRRVRRWPARPRWLVPATVITFVVAALPAFASFSIPDAAIGTSDCIPVRDAWRPVVESPGSGTYALWQGAALAKPTPADLQDSVARKAFNAERRAQWEELVATPAYRRAERYVFWSVSQDACAPGSRDRLLLSAGLLACGALLLTGATVAAARRSSRFRSQ